MDNEKEYYKQLGVLANAIGGEIWNSGGGCVGVLICGNPTQENDPDIFFGFADDVLGWDISTQDGDILPITYELYNSQPTTLTIDDIDAVITCCREVMEQAKTNS